MLLEGNGWVVRSCDSSLNSEITIRNDGSEYIKDYTREFYYTLFA